MSFRQGFSCSDCGIDVKLLMEFHYKIKSEIWLKIANSSEFLCIGCLEKRLGRRILNSDFDHNDNINFKPFKRVRKSTRLLNRLDPRR